MTVVAIQRIRGGELTSATSVTLSIVNSAGVVVLAPTVVPATSEGAYSYETTLLPAGSYTATWVFTTTGYPTDTISRAFTVDAPMEINEGVTLMEIERLVSRRIGPYYRRRLGAGSTVNSIYSERFKSSLNLGSYEDSYVLRRGLTYGDELVTNFVSGDRVRQAYTYDASTGILTVDRAYSLAPVEDEAIELHSIDPEEELRPAVLDGLTRCFFWDNIEVQVTGSGIYNIDISATAPWITQVNQVQEVSLSYPSQLLPPTRMQWWQAYREGKNIKLHTKGGAVGSVSLLVLRPASSLVNGEMSLSGPNDDLDILYIDRDYAAWAAVLECWKTIPEVLTPLATQNMRPSRADAATEFTKKSQTLVQQVPETFQVDFGSSDLVQIGNLAEPVI